MDHAGLEVEIVDRLLCHGDNEVSVLGRDSARIVPLKIADVSAISESAYPVGQ